MSAEAPAKAAAGKRTAAKSARRRAREFALQGLYQWLLSKADGAEIEAHLQEQEAADFARLDRVHFDALLHGCIREAVEIDALLAAHADRKTSLLSPVEHAVLMIGVYELKHCVDIPYRVALNESVELAKSFGGTDGHKYVNGVLDKAAAELRPAEVAASRAARGALMRLASRLEHIEPFYVMECAKTAVEIAHSAECDPARGGEPMIFLNIGEPDFHAPRRVVQAAEACMRSGRTQYTQATGMQELRERIAAWYGTRFSLDIAPQRIVVTAGASAALQLACLALFEAGDEVLMPDPSYPCNRHFVAAAGASARLLPAAPEARFQLDAAGVRAHWNEHTCGVLLASPSNPTGTSIARSEMAAIAQAVRERGGVTLVDEIYLGLSYDAAYGHSALEHGEDIVSINSFSKYFSMTGWRLGWLVLPEALVAPVEKLAQNLYICPSTVAQHAALACFDEASIEEYERRREQFRRRRDFVVPALQSLGLKVPVQPDGAFYAWVDCSAFSDSSWDFCFDMMRRAHVALTPGRDFGPHAAQRYLRLSFASSMQQLEQALQRLQRVLR